jgi:hypothetical protein
LLGIIEHDLGVLLLGQGLARDGVARTDKVADDRFVTDDRDVLVDV